MGKLTEDAIREIEQIHSSWFSISKHQPCFLFVLKLRALMSIVGSDGQLGN